MILNVVYHEHYHDHKIVRLNYCLFEYYDTLAQDMNVSPQSVWKKAVPIVCTALLALYFGADPIFSGIKDLIQDFSSNDLTQYRTLLKKCVDDKTTAASGTKIFDLEYECAIDIGATFYAQEPDKAIRLCKKFYPIPVKAGGDEFYQKYEDNLQSSVCRLALERRLRSSSTSSTTR